MRPDEICKPTAVGAPSGPVKNSIRSVKVVTATVRFQGLLMTSGVRYAVAEKEFCGLIEFLDRIRMLSARTLFLPCVALYECKTSASPAVTPASFSTLIALP